MAAAGGDVLGQHMHAANQVLGVAGERFAQQFGIGQHEIRRRQRIGDLPNVEIGFLLGVRIEAGGIADQLVGPVGGEQIDLPEEIEELVRGPLRVGKALVVGRGRGDRRCRFAGEPLDRRSPQIEVGFAEPGLQLEAALRIGQPVFRDLARCLDHFGDFIGGAAVGVAALLARLEIGRERPAALFDEARQIARKRLDVDAFRPSSVRCDGARTGVLAMEPHERSSMAE